MTALAYRRTAPSDRRIARRKVRIQRVRMGELNWLALLLLASIVLLFDAIVIGRQIKLIRLPGEMTDVDMAKSGAMAYVELERGILQVDKFTGIGSAGPVLDGAQSAFAAARSREDVGRELSAISRGLASAVQSDRAEAARSRIAELVEADARVKSGKAADSYVLVTSIGGEVKVQDRQSALSRTTLDAITKDPSIQRAPYAIEVQITQSGVTFDSGDPVASGAALSREIASLTASIAEERVSAGLAEMDGPGVQVRAYDAPSGYGWDEIVHQKDILDILDALFAAGARGAMVGGERIVAASSVRCVGPVVLVNQRPVPVNPIKVYAVGDRAVLAKALVPIAGRFAKSGKRLEVVREPSVRLAANHKGGLQW
ncbi:MAG: DUF881 domain-containing protein [Clostridia bacterium]|nr:DUF881 domain-containing protein [Clostridia bacterium]